MAAGISPIHIEILFQGYTNHLLRLRDEIVGCIAPIIDSDARILYCNMAILAVLSPLIWLNVLPDLQTPAWQPHQSPPQRALVRSYCKCWT